MSKKETIVFVNGEFVPKSEAKVSVFDQGFIFGDGVFDTLISSNGYVFKLDQHIDRLFRSAKAVGIKPQRTKENLRELVLETVRRNGLREAYIKIIFTRGVGPKPIMGKGDVANPTLVIFAVPPVSAVPEDRVAKGARLLSTTIKRTHPDSLDPRIKSLNYQPNMLMRREAIEGGADEAVCYGFDGYVAEGGAENLWVVRERVLMTPHHGVLEGITRETIFEIARELGVSAISTNIGRYDLYQSDEIFLCSTAGGIIPVIEVDHRMIGDGRPGPITERVRRRYAEMLREGRHGTPVFKGLKGNPGK